MVGMCGLETEGVSEMLIVGIGGVETVLIWISGGSGRFNVGTIGADAVDSGSRGLFGSPGNALFKLSRLTRRWPPTADCLRSISFGFQSWSKLTMGRPGRSLTTVGVGSFGLRSFNLILVAARISSPRTSTPFFITGLAEVPLRSLSLALVESGGVGGNALDTYEGSRDLVGGFLCMSNFERGFVSLQGAVIKRSDVSRAKWTFVPWFRDFELSGFGAVLGSL